ncbi:MAG: ribonuclease D [Thioalkalivibrio sp.]|nr:MAG: ribonuclease D [Thioalkalivibrio sp.]
MRDHGLVETTAQLQDLAGALADSAWVAMDTEFMREKTYFPQLCLIQVATPDHIACVDPQALPDLGPLCGLLQDPDVLKVFHSASQDLEVLYLVTGDVPAPVFDTQIAASLLGYGEQVGYANLVQAVLGIELDKTQSRTDWSRRPLRAEQLSYARDDVRHLVLVYQHLQKELEAFGRTAWIAPEMEAITRPELYQPRPEVAWRRVSGHKRLKPRELAVLRELAAWREDEARRLDRPRRWILGDDLLLLIARVRPADLDALQELRGFPKGIGTERARQLLMAVERGVAMPREEWPVLATRAKPLTETEEVVADVAAALLRDLARQQRIGPEAIGGRRDIVALMRGDGDARLARGWRHEVAGRELQRWLEGRSAIGCDRDRLALSERDAPASAAPVGR